MTIRLRILKRGGGGVGFLFVKSLLFRLRSSQMSRKAKFHSRDAAKML